jgi:hypothetical protein
MPDIVSSGKTAKKHDLAPAPPESSAVKAKSPAQGRAIQLSSVCSVSHQDG